MSQLSEALENIDSGGLKAHLLRAKLIGGLRESNEMRQRQRYEQADRSVIHVGNLLGGEEFCSRKVYYAHMEGESGYAVHGDQTLLTFYEGDQTEIQFKDLLRRAKVPIFEPKQQKLVGKIIGTPDVAFTFMKRDVIGEVKSMHAAAWRKLTEPTAKFVQQLGTYMGLYQIKDGIVAVKGKGEDDWKIFWLTWPQVKSKVAEVLRRGLAVHGAIETGELPSRIADASPVKNAVCRRCAFKEMCFVRDKAR